MGGGGREDGDGRGREGTCYEGKEGGGGWHDAAVII